MNKIETERGRWKRGTPPVGEGAIQVGGKGKYIEPKAKGRQRLTHSKKIKKQERITKQQSEKADKRKAHRLREREKKKKKEREKGKYIYVDIVYISGLRTDLTPLWKPRAVCAAPFFGCAFRRFACATWRMSNALFALPRDAFARQPDKHDKGSVQIQYSRQVGAGVKAK